MVVGELGWHSRRYHAAVLGKAVGIVMRDCDLSFTDVWNFLNVSQSTLYRLTRESCPLAIFDSLLMRLVELRGIRRNYFDMDDDFV